MMHEPFGMRFLTPVTPQTTTPQGVRYDARLQIGVTAEGNPWHELAPKETRTETSLGDGKKTGTDSEGTDLW